MRMRQWFYEEGITRTVGGLFGGGNAVVAPPPPAPPPPAPQISDASRRAQEEADALARKRGRSSTVKTGPDGVGDTPIQVKTLVGS